MSQDVNENLGQRKRNPAGRRAQRPTSPAGEITCLGRVTAVATPAEAALSESGGGRSLSPPLIRATVCILRFLAIFVKSERFGLKAESSLIAWNTTAR